MAGFGGAFGSNTATVVAQPTYNPNKDAEVISPPDDSISSINFSPKANYLVATSWDNQVIISFTQVPASASKATIVSLAATETDQPH
jgi:mRNA export factor